MQRITVSVDDPLAIEMDALFRRRGYDNRSEGMRDLVREAIGEERFANPAHAASVASFSYIFNHRIRALAARLAEMQHAHHDLIASTTLLHLDHDHSLETVLLRGPTAAVRAFADQVRAERGVRSAMLNIIGVEPDDRHHGPHDHVHSGRQHLVPSRVG